MKQHKLTALLATLIVAQLCVVVGGFVAFDVGYRLKMELHNLFGGTPDAEVDPEPVVIQDIFGRYGYMDHHGNVVVWPRFQYASQFSEGLASVEVGEKYGYINIKGELVIQPSFGSADDFRNGLAVVCVDDEYGIINSAGDFVVQPQYAYLHELSGGFFSFCTKESSGNIETNQNPRFGIIDKQGNVIYTPEFQFIREASDGLIQYSEDNSCGYLDSSYHKAIAAQYMDAKDFHDGLAIVRDKETCLWGIINKQESVVVPFRYSYIRDFSDGLIAAKDNESRRWGFIDSKGNIVIPCQYQLENNINVDFFLSMGYLSFQDGLACIPMKNNQAIVINKDGKIIVDRFPLYDMIKDEYGTSSELVRDCVNNYGYSGNGLHWIEKSPGHLTFFDNKGEDKFTTVGEVANTFSEGQCRVGKDMGPYSLFGKYGYIDANGKLLIGFRFSHANDFHNGLAEVDVGHSDIFGYINKKGDFLWLPSSIKRIASILAASGLASLLFLILRLVYEYYNPKPAHQKKKRSRLILLKGRKYTIRYLEIPMSSALSFDSGGHIYVQKEPNERDNPPSALSRDASTGTPQQVQEPQEPEEEDQ